jgi:hypothetical protein
MAEMIITIPGIDDVASMMRPAMRTTVRQAGALITIYAQRGLGKNGRPVQAYTRDYRKRKENAGRKGAPDYTLTGQTLRAVRGGTPQVSADGTRGQLVVGGVHRGAAPSGGTVKPTGRAMPVAELATYLDRQRPFLGITDSKRLRQLRKIAERELSKQIRRYNASGGRLR